MPDVFLSYKRDDQRIVGKLVDGLRAAGVDVWWDKDIPASAPWEATIERTLAEAKVVLVCWSEAAVASENVRAEARWARERGRLVQVFVRPCSPPLFFGERQGVDLSGWSGAASDPRFKEISSAIRAHLDALTDPAVASQAAAPPPATPAWANPRSRPLAWAVAGLMLLVLVGAGLWAFRDHLPFGPKPEPTRVAVLPFDTLGGGADMGSFADGLLDETLSTFSSDRVQALSRTDSVVLRGPQADDAVKRLDIGLFLDGTVRKEGDVIKVRAYLNDARDHTTLWSADFEGRADQADALQAKVAARTADVAHWALVGRTKGGPGMDSPTLSAFIEASDEITNGGDRIEPLLRQVIAKTPNFAMAHAHLALALLPDAEAAKREAVRALQLNPNIAEAYMVLSFLQPRTAWAARQDAFAKGLARDSSFPYLWFFENKFFSEVGRNQDALTAAQRTAALNFMFVGGGVSLCTRLTLQGRLDEAAPVCVRADRLWPEDTFNDFNQFFAELEAGQNKAALDRLRHSFFNLPANVAAAKVWTQFLQARLAGDDNAARSAALLMATLADADGVDRRNAYIALAMTGQVDPALRQAAAIYPAGVVTPVSEDAFSPALLFAPGTDSVRRDPRFMALAAKIGLVDYWRTSGQWPDFCADPKLPYDCKTVAAGLKTPAPKATTNGG